MENLEFGVLWVSLLATTYGVLWVIAYFVLAGFDHLAAFRRRRLGIETAIRVKDLLARGGHEPLRRRRFRKGRHHLRPVRGRHSRIDNKRPRRTARRRVLIDH